MRRELPRLLGVAAFHLHLAQLGDDFRDHRGFRAHQRLLRFQGFPERLLTLQTQALSPERTPEFVIDAHRRDVGFVAFLMGQQPQHEARFALKPGPGEEISQQLFRDVGGQDAIRGDFGDVRNRHELLHEVQASPRRTGFGRDQIAVRPGREFLVESGRRALLAPQQRVPDTINTKVSVSRNVYE